MFSDIWKKFEVDNVVPLEISKLSIVSSINIIKKTFVQSKFWGTIYLNLLHPLLIIVIIKCKFFIGKFSLCTVQLHKHFQKQEILQMQIPLLRFTRQSKGE